MRRLSILLFIFLLAVSSVVAGGKPSPRTPAGTPKSDVFMQGFYWNSTPGGIWYDSLSSVASRLASAGFSAIWFPSPTKGASGASSMGYDPYDHYDFGEYNQAGSIETRFGSRQELVNAINIFHANGISVFADAVMGHMDGGEQYVPYDCDISPTLPANAWLVFNYPNGSGRFKKSAINFYPNHLSNPPCDWNQANYHGVDPAYKFGEYLALTQPYVSDSLRAWGHYLRNVLGFDGFRLDEAKALDPAFMGPWLQDVDSGGYAVAEYFGSGPEIGNWHNLVQNVYGGKVSMFDFPLRFALQAMCNTTSGFYDMTQLDYASLVSNGWSGFDVVTFAENHDFDRIGWDGSIGSGNNPIVTDKHMAYAYIMFSEGRPCVFFKDYFTYGLSGKIDTLMWIRRTFLGGGTTQRSGLNPWYIRQDNSTDQGALATDIYVARRNGYGSQPGGYLVINDESNMWIDVWVDTDMPIGTVYRDYTGRDVDKVVVGPSGGTKNRVKLWCPPRNYTIYVADTTQHISLPPSFAGIPPLYGFINTPYSYQLPVNNRGTDSLTFSMTGNPSWLSVSSNGFLTGTCDSTVATYPIRVVMSDTQGDTSVSTFTLSIVSHPVMDGQFEGSSLWGPAIAVADTVPGYGGAEVKDLYVTSDAQYYYFGAHVKARQWMDWAFLINTKIGGGTTESWSRSITYDHPNPPDYIIRGAFNGSAEFNIWIGPYWGGVGSPMAASESGESIASDSAVDGWVEARMLKSSMGNAQVLGVQCYLTGNQNSAATFDACPDDEHTTLLSGVTTHLHYYAIYGTPRLTWVNLQAPSADTIGLGSSVPVYARAFGLGITDTGGAGSGVQAWIGYSAANTNPGTWSDWIPAGFSAKAGVYDAYTAPIGSAIASEGVYFYASRFQYNGGNFVYGGTSAGGGGIWDSIHYRSGVLTVFGPPGIPALSIPANGSMNEAPITDFSWGDVPNAQTYEFQVAHDSLFTRIVFADSAVTGAGKRVTGLLTDSTYYWRVRTRNVYGTSPYSPAWSFAVSKILEMYTLASGWNLISVPLTVSDPRASAIYPNILGSAFAFSTSGSYVIAESLYNSVAYWVKYASADSTPIIGLARHRDTIALVAGWNMIGSISDTVDCDSIDQIPPGIVTSSYFGYSGGYIKALHFVPGCGYWVKTSAPGHLVLVPAPSGSASHQVFAPPPDPGASAIIVRDASGAERRLTIVAGTMQEEVDRAELPPVPPGDVLDARFDGNLGAIQMRSTERRMSRIHLAGNAYPMELRWSVHGLSPASTIELNGKATPMNGLGSLTVHSQEDRIDVRLVGADAAPVSYALHQNYPNPFNPSTTIEYDLPADSRVTLTIYSVLGDVVAQLVNGIVQAGYHGAVWTPNASASGVYFCRLEATGVGDAHPVFTAWRKLLFVR